MPGIWVKNDFYGIVNTAYTVSEPYNTEKPWGFVGHFNWLTKTWNHFTIPHIDSFTTIPHEFIISNGVMTAIEIYSGKDRNSKMIGVVRIPTKKPESLWNLSFFAVKNFANAENLPSYLKKLVCMF